MRKLPIPLTAGFAVLLTGGAVWGLSADIPVSSEDDTSVAPQKNDSSVVAGTVTDSDGEPVAGAMVAPEPIDNQKQPIPEIGVLTSDDGSYEWKLPPGEYEITIHLEGEELGGETVAVESGETANGDITVE